MNYLLQNSDEEHPITVNQMIQYLESNGIAAERKSIYDDIEALRTFGMAVRPGRAEPEGPVPGLVRGPAGV